MIQHEVTTRDKWVAARKELLAAEKEITRQKDELSRRRRELPWVKVDKNYVFDGPKGKQSLGDLFEGHSQLIIYHFMFGPGWKEGCPSCSFVADHLDGTLAHLTHRDVTLAVVSRASAPEIEAFKKRMGWGFTWVSSFYNDFNFDYHVSFKKEDFAKGKVYYNFDVTEFPAEEAPGASVFYKEKSGEIFHTYSTYGRGAELILGTYNLLDIAPKGRDEDGLAFSMAWVRHHDRYDENYKLDPTAGVWEPTASPHACCAQND
jgi:predicted dithiol-disulfide oxidoreductase (DUF899 family)